MKNIPNLSGKFNMQIDVPHSEYGNATYIAWLEEHGISDYAYCGAASSGNGYTNGISNRESVYMVYNIQDVDACAFQIQFPHCKVHLCEQFDFSRV